MNFMKCNLSRMQQLLFFASKRFFLKKAIKHRFENLSVDVFYALQVSFEMIYYAFAKEPGEILWARLEEKFLEFVGK